MQISIISCIVTLAMLFSSAAAFADTTNGDQFLDGIGETALSARYLFSNNTNDWTRNTLNAKLSGTASYLADEQFGNVISLSGESYLTLPGSALNGLDSLSITGWIYISSPAPWQRFFDIGNSTRSYLYCTPMGQQRENGCRLRIAKNGYGSEDGPTTFRVPAKKWTHIAAVLDSKRKKLSLYIDGINVGSSSNIDCKLSDLLDQDNPDNNHIYLGKSLYDGDQTLQGRLYDVRFYNIALNPKNIAEIHHNAISDEEFVYTGKEITPNNDTEQYNGPHQLYAGLVEVDDTEVQTSTGTLPQLPYYLPGKYKNSSTKEPVRVIWPSPKDNSQVKTPGSYTITGTVPATDLKPKAIVTVVDSPNNTTAKQQALIPFALGEVTLNTDSQGRKTPFIKNRDKFILTLAQTNPDSFLYNFRDAFGQDQPANVRPLGVWDSQTTKLRGHATGHYLTAIAQAYASTTYDQKLHENFANKIDYMIDVLYDLAQRSGKPATTGGDCVADPTKVPFGPGKNSYNSDLSKDGIRTDYWNWGTGFISGYPPDQFIMLEKGATYGGSNRQVWAPYYTLHKILAGLMDCYEVAGNEKALEIAKGMGLWVYNRLAVVPTENRIKMWNMYIAGEYGGMNEAMARLNLITGDKRFLECAKLFDNIDFFFGNQKHEHGLACNVDTIRGKHANQHIPQIIGSLETYKAAGTPQYMQVAENFWNICSHSYMYCIGGVAGARNPNNAECFTAQPDTLFTNGLSQGGQNETCATYNLLKLARQLFMFEKQPKYMDYYEQALYNHILSSVAENNPGNTYHVPLNPGAHKSFSNAHMNGFTCCNGTALESNTKLQDTIYLKNTDDSAVYVNMFIPSSLNWKSKDVIITQSTSMPYSDSTKLSITTNKNTKFTIYLRVPKWAVNGYSVSINNTKQNIKAIPGTYIPLNRNWQTSDTIEITMPMDFHLSPIMDQPNIASIFYGPVLLAVQEPDSRVNWRKITLNADNLASSFECDPATLTFTTNGVTLKPFYETYGYHSVYMDITLE